MYEANVANWSGVGGAQGTVQVPRAVGNSKPDHPPGTSDKHRPAYGKKGRGKNFRKLKSVSLQLLLISKPQ